MARFDTTPPSRDQRFSCPWWLRGSHLQSLWGPTFRSRALVQYVRERLDTPDGDELWLDHLPGGSPTTPHLLVLHGLEGSSYSPYVQGLMTLAFERGWRATAFNCRSCARDPGDTITWIPNRTSRLYHSGETGDFDFVVRTLQQREPKARMVAAGISMGGNVLLKWLGENPTQHSIVAAVSMSAPYDLGAGADHLERFVGRYYTRHFLQTLRAKLRHHAATFPQFAARIDLPRALRAQSFREFDEAATAPLNGFADADDFYERCSSIAFVERIATPTLCISAADDPLIPPSVMEQARHRFSASIEPLFTRHGGHVGFVGGPHPWSPRYWAEERMLEWLEHRL